MENENNQPTNQPIYPPTATEPEVPRVVEAPSVPTPSVAPKPKVIDTLKTKFNNFPKNTKILILVMVVLFLIIILLSILVALFGKKQTAIVATPSPSPISVTPGPNVILNASRYATDSGVLKIEGDLNNIQKQLETTDVKQSDLTPPNLDYNINFNQ